MAIDVAGLFDTFRVRIHQGPLPLSPSVALVVYGTDKLGNAIGPERIDITPTIGRRLWEGTAEERQHARLWVEDQFRLGVIAGIDQIDEGDALDDAAVLHVETGDDARLEGHCVVWRPMPA